MPVVLKCARAFGFRPLALNGSQRQNLPLNLMRELIRGVRESGINRSKRCFTRVPISSPDLAGAGFGRGDSIDCRQ